MPIDLKAFVRESNYIEGIYGEPSEDQVAAHIIMLDATTLCSELLQEFVAMVEPTAQLRDKPGLNVRVGRHIAPLGGPDIRVNLRKILQTPATPFHTHRAYLTLHPFTDCNGRSARALWLRQMGGPQNVPLGFLHHWYYQSLEAGDAR